MSETGAGDARTAVLRANLTAVRDRIARAAQAAGRDPAGLTLIAVTKTFAAADVARLAELGLREFGENRDAEAQAKAAQFPQLRWHFVGQLQRNKARSVAGYASVVHSVDRPALVTALAAAAQGRDQPLEVLLQVDLSADGAAPGRGGARPAELAALAETVAAASQLRLAGLMAVAPLPAPVDRGARVDPSAAAFDRLAAVAADFQAAHPDARVVSAGMSGDLEVAVRHGATHLRIGTALLGDRPPILG